MSRKTTAQRPRKRRAPSTPATPPPEAAGPTRRGPLTVGLLVAALVVCATAWWLLRPSGPAAEAPAADAPTASDAVPGRVPGAEASYLGSAACADCHREQYAAWQSSQHARAMQHASEQTVLGDFNDATHTQDGVTTTFFRRDGKYMVRTDGPDGAPGEFEVEYTFGLEPLQQYLVALPGGRLQALAVTWDSRPREQGGQRWFRQYPGETLDHRDELHWTQRSQNWNFMCADCHSTDIRKGYDAASGAFDTRWAEISVGCEACHGPGSAHLAWSRGTSGEQAAKGLTVSLDSGEGVSWTPDPHTGNARRSGPAPDGADVEVCAPCHSRRSQFAEGHRAGDPLLDHYLPALLSPGLYHADGQQRDEVFVWGSFLQSKMHRAGVGCGDCHEPHSQALRAPGNGVCLQCHAGAKYDGPRHHFHAPSGEAAQCVNCHMSAETYMVVDPRRDHGFRVPRPDLSAATGSPNACNRCHANESADWAAEAVARWYGAGRRAEPHFGQALQAGRLGRPGAAQALLGLVNDTATAPIVRASAIELLARYPGRAAEEALRRALRDTEPLVRLAAVDALGWLGPQAQAAAVSPLLGDPRRAVRIAAARVLVAAGAPLDARAPRALREAVAEFEAVQRGNLERPEAWMHLGNLQLRRGDGAAAEAAFRGALRVDPAFVPAYVNLADLHRGRQRDNAAERVLREGLQAAPRAAALHEALGLTLVRQGRKPEALQSLAAAVEADPAQPRHAYLYALALDDAGRRDQALEVLASASRDSGDRGLLLTLAQLRTARGDQDGAREALRTLAAINPDDPALAGFAAQQ